MYLDYKNKNKNKKTWETKRGGSLLHEFNYSVDMLIIILLEFFFFSFLFLDHAE